ncbi:MAG: methionine--tRNA ligase subunit beta, partial [Bacteroidota bacterium]
NRALVLTHKYFKGIIPPAGEFFDAEKEVLRRLDDTPEKVGKALESFKFRDALSEFMDLARAGNKYLADTEPWKLIKTDCKRVETILNLALQIAANLSLLGEPFLPNTSKNLRSMLNLDSGDWKVVGSNEILPAGHQIDKPSLLFEKIEDELIQKQIDKLENTKVENETTSEGITPIKEVITFDDFVKMDIRVGTILEAETIPKSKKLLKLLVDTGVDQRTILSGIAQHFSAEEVVNKQVCVLVNLAPRKMMGIESKGMILMAEDNDGNLSFIAPPSVVGNGSKVS